MTNSNFNVGVDVEVLFNGNWIVGTITAVSNSKCTIDVKYTKGAAKYAESDIPFCRVRDYEVPPMNPYI